MTIAFVINSTFYYSMTKQAVSTTKRSTFSYSTNIDMSIETSSCYLSLVFYPEALSCTQGKQGNSHIPLFVSSSMYMWCTFSFSSYFGNYLGSEMCYTFNTNTTGQ